MARKWCFTPSEAAAPSKLSARIGQVVEWVVRQEYCFNRNGCDEFQRGGTGVDFFDDNVIGSGTTRCRFLAEYLAARHPALDAKPIWNDCEVQKIPVDRDDPDDFPNDRFAIPDIITDLPGVRSEFYEVKANSTSGVAAGRLKLSTFLSMIDFLKHTDPDIGNLVKGRQFRPDRTFVIYQRAYLGILPVEVQLHYFLKENGLIVYEFCVTAETELAEAFAKAVIISALLVLMALLASRALGRSIPFPGQVPVLADSVGPNGVNNTQDVRYVAALLADWASIAGEPVPPITDTVSDEMTTALSKFQEASAREDTAGDIAPGDETLIALQQFHLDNLAQAVDLSELGLDGIDPSTAHALLTDSNDEADVEPLTQDDFDNVVADYLQAVHDYA